MSTVHELRKEYLNPQKVMQDSLETSTSFSDVRVIVYDVGFGIRMIAPNPLDKDRADEIENQYRQGHYTERYRRYLTRKQFDDPKFWNS